MKKYLWITDPHFDKVPPWDKYSFFRQLDKEEPKAIFVTGDISNGRNTMDDLAALADSVPCNIYVVLGNHDYHWSSIAKTHDKLRALCQKHSNLTWMTEAGVVHLDEEVALIGAEGWYDAEKGKPEYLNFTFDWFLIDDFRKLPSMEARIDAWRQLAAQSGKDVSDKVEKAIEQKYKSIYLLTHFPPWKEATRDQGTILEPFWLPYNCNLHLGRALEATMAHHKKKHLTVLCGHTHTPEYIRVSRNIDCQVGAARLFKIRSQTIFV